MRSIYVILEYKKGVMFYFSAGKNDSNMETNSFGLNNGSTYIGEQTTGTGSFKIDMEVNMFDLKRGFICGTFTIYNITSEHSILKTYFEGHLMGINQTLSSINDTKLWAKFPCWKQYFKDTLVNHDPWKSPYFFIKIKELFILHNPRMDLVHGASIDGYYYCCYSKRSDSFGGFYQVTGACRQGSQRILLMRTKEKVSQTYEWA